MEAVHEALIRNWPALMEWLNRDRAFQSWLRQLKPRVDDWRTNPSDDGTLLRGGSLAVAEDWIARRGGEVNEDEKAFVASGVAQRDAEKRRVEEELRREQERLSDIADAQEKRASAQQRVRRALIAVALVIVTSGSLVGWQYGRNSDLQASLATNQASLMASMAAVERQQKALTEAWDTGRKKQSELDAKDEELKREAVSLDTKGVQLKHQHADFLGELCQRRIDPRQFRSRASIGDERRKRRPRAAAELCCDVDIDGDARRCSLKSAMASRFPGGSWRGAVCRFSLDGARIVTGSEDKTARIWDAATGKEIAVLSGHEGGLE